MTEIFMTGFFLGLSLIVAIGAQNAFILRQGLLRQHIGLLVLFCGLSDALLIWGGVFGLGELIQPIMKRSADWLYLLAALWLAGYGVLRLRSSMRPAGLAGPAGSANISAGRAVLVCAGLTFLNPHVWLDTVILLGLFSLPYSGAGKIAYASGAAAASFCFFALLGFGAARLSGLLVRPRSWQILDLAIGLLMMGFAAAMLVQTSWLAS